MWRVRHLATRRANKRAAVRAPSMVRPIGDVGIGPLGLITEEQCKAARLNCADQLGPTHRGQGHPGEAPVNAVWPGYTWAGGGAAIGPARPVTAC